jgi:hypothetical protein
MSPTFPTRVFRRPDPVMMHQSSCMECNKEVDKATTIPTTTINVLDIAGGKGTLSVELALQGALCCTIIDPLVRKHGPKSILPNHLVKRIKKHGHAPLPHYMAAYFDQTTFLLRSNDDHSAEMALEEEKSKPSSSSSLGASSTLIGNDGHAFVREATLLVGLHPDECTDDILDVALHYDKSVTIVPCCVFADLSPHRTLAPCGTSVQTYEQFLDYLLQKDARLQRATLPFEGRNQVIYFKSPTTTTTTDTRGAMPQEDEREF